MTLALEIGGIRDPQVQRALQVIAQQFPVAATGGGGGGAPSGPAGGDLTGTYPNPGIASLVIVDGDISASAAIAESKLALATDAAAGVGSRRTLGTGALQAAAGNDTRLSDSRAPNGSAGGDLSGTYPNPGIAAGAIVNADINAAAAIAKTKLASLDVVNADVNAAAAIAETKLALATDAAAGTGSRRTLGTGATQAAAGNDARFTDARTPTAHQSTHQSGNADALTGNLDATARNGISRNGAAIAARRGLNLIEGTNVTITAADNAGSERVDVTINASAGGGGSTLNDYKESCRVASTANVTVASPGATIDGVSLASGDRVFLKDQTAAAENGIYVWNGAAVAMTRATDADTATELSDSTFVSVEQGATNRDTVWELATDNPITLGTTSLAFTRVHPAYAVPTPGSMTAGFGPFLPNNAILENMNRWATPLTGLASQLTSGTIRTSPLGVLRAGQTATALNWVIATAAVTITNSWAGIATFPDRVVRARSNTVTAATAANLVQTWTFSSSYTPTTDVALLAFVMFQATTLPAYYGISVTNAVHLNNPAIAYLAQAGQTTPIAVGTTLTVGTIGSTVGYFFLT